MIRFLRVLMVVLLLAPTLPVQPVRASFSCTDVHTIWARGANDAIGGFDWARFVNTDLRNRILAPTTQSDYQLGNPGYNGFVYQPVDTGQTIADAEAAIAGYSNSVFGGMNELVAYLTDRAAACPAETYVLGGYSEGAQVVGSALFGLAQSVRDRIAFVALFGDVKLETGNSPGPTLITPPFGPACISGERPWKRGSAPCGISGGFFLPRDPYVPADMQARVGSWCRDKDAACTGVLIDVPGAVLVDPFVHLRYFDANSDSAEAAQEAVTHLSAMLPAKAATFDVSLDQLVLGLKGADLAIVFDTTGSMSSSIAEAKSQATTLANDWLSLFQNGRVGLAEFKDQGDPFVSRVDLNLTNNATAFQNAVNGLTATGGGDIPEAQLSGIMSALNGMSWMSGATKAVVVITDAQGKDPEPVTDFTRVSVNQRAREIDPVGIYGVNVSSDQTVADWMAPMATATSGEVVTLVPGQSLSDALSSLFNSVHANPVARLDGPIVAPTSQGILFDASRSFDASAAISSYKWDFDGNGTTDRTTTTPTTTYTYPGTFAGIASVEVVGADGRSALATTGVTVNSVGNGSLLPVAPATASASVTGAAQVTVSWTPAANDRADGYRILANGTSLQVVKAADPHSAVINGLDLSQPVTLYLTSLNGYGQSGGTATPPVGGNSAWSGIVRVNDDSTTQAQVAPDVALGPNGAAIGLWQDYRPSPDIDIYSSRWDPATQAWGANTRVNDVTTGQQYKPSIAIDANNNAYAAWVDLRNGRQDIYFSKRSGTTGLWGANVRVNSVTNYNSQDQPTIAVSPSGDAIALWLRSANNKLNVWSARLPTGSSTWGPEIRVTTNQTTQKQAPKVVFGPNGTGYAVWMDPNVGDANIWYATLPAGSSTWSTNTKISDDPGTAFQGTADIGVDGAGNVLVAWTDRRATPYQLRVRRLPAGGSWGASTLIAGDGGNSPSIAVRSDGRAYLAWHDGDFTTAYPKLWGSTFTASTGTWSAPERIDMNGADHGAAAAAVAIDSTRLFVLWKNALSIPSGANNDDILARWRTP